MSTPPPMPQRLEAEGLVLRHPGEADIALMARHIADPRVHRQTGTLHPGYNEDDARAFLDSLPARREAGRDYIFAVEEDGAFCGIMGLHRREDWLPYEIGYWIAPPAWGHGVATRAGRVILDWLDTGIGQRVSLAVVNTDNPASRRVLEKLGYMLAGRTLKYSRGRDAWLPVHQMVRIIGDE